MGCKHVILWSQFKEVIIYGARAVQKIVLTDILGKKFPWIGDTVLLFHTKSHVRSYKCHN